MYYSKNIGKKDELSLNLIGSHYTTNSSQFDHEWNIGDNSDVFNNDMNLKAKQTGIVGEIAHVHSFEKGKLSSGYRISNTAISNDLVNLLGTSHYDVNYLEQYLYTEYSGKWDKLGYRVGMGVTNIHNKSAETTQDDWAPTPKLVLSYDLAKNQSLRFTSSYTSNSPWASALSSNVVQVVPNIIKKGNPYLKTQHLFRNSLIYSKSTKYYDFNADVFYNIVDKYFAEYFVLATDSSQYILTFNNADFKEYGVEISGSVKPFANDLLIIKTWLSPVVMNMKLKSGENITKSFIRNYFSISSNYKSFGINYQFNFPISQLEDGVFLQRDENANHVFLTYKIKDITLSTGMYFIGTPSIYEKETLPESIVQQQRFSQILNNKNLFVFGL